MSSVMSEPSGPAPARWGDASRCPAGAGPRGLREAVGERFVRSRRRAVRERLEDDAIAACGSGARFHEPWKAMNVVLSAPGAHSRVEEERHRRPVAETRRLVPFACATVRLLPSPPYSGASTSFFSSFSGSSRASRSRHTVDLHQLSRPGSRPNRRRREDLRPVGGADRDVRSVELPSGPRAMPIPLRIPSRAFAENFWFNVLASYFQIPARVSGSVRVVAHGLVGVLLLAAVAAEPTLSTAHRRWR